MPVLQIQLALWSDCLKTINNRSRTIFKSPDWTDYCYNQIQQAFQESRRYIVITASPTVYQVEVGNNKSHTVKLTSAIPIWEAHNLEPGSIDISCTCCYPDDYAILCKHTIAVLREARADLSSYYEMVTWYSVTTYRNTYSYPIEPIRLEDFKDIQLYVTDNEYESDDPFAKQIKLKAKAPKLAQLRGRPKKRRIRKVTEGRPKKQLRCGHCKELGHNRKDYRNGRKEPEVMIISSEASSGEASSGEASSGEASSDEANSGEANSDEASSGEDKDELA